MFLVFVDLKTQDNSKAMFHTCPTLPQPPLAEKLIERKKKTNQVHLNQARIIMVKHTQKNNYCNNNFRSAKKDIN